MIFFLPSENKISDWQTDYKNRRKLHRMEKQMNKIHFSATRGKNVEKTGIKAGRKRITYNNDS